MPADEPGYVYSRDAGGEWTESRGLVPQSASDEEDYDEHAEAFGVDTDKGLPRDVVYAEDMYDATVVAAFGGIQMKIMRGKITIHPLIPLALAIMLFWIQGAILLYLRLNQDLAKPVHGDGYIESPYNVLPKSKCLMILVLSLVLLNELVSALRLLLFVLNPTTWIDVKRPNQAKQGGMWRGYILAPCACMGAFLKAFMAYIVLADSISVVLVCDTCQDAIFNGLALTFVADLDEVWWKVSETVFRLTFSKGWEFEMLPAPARREMMKMALFKIPQDSCLRSGNGARFAEELLTNIILIAIYTRQLLLTANALRTDVLPVARDMCTIWSMSQQNSLMGRVSREALRGMSLNVHPNSLLNEVCNPDLDGYCSDKYGPTKIQDMWTLGHEFRIQMFTGTMIIGMVLFVPRFFQFLAERLQFKILFEDDADDGKESDHGRRASFDLDRHSVPPLNDEIVKLVRETIRQELVNSKNT